MTNQKVKQLPDGWEKESMRDVLNILESGGRPKGGARKEGIPSIGAEHLDNSGNFKFDKMKFIPDDYFNSMKKGWIKREDVLIVKDGATIGKISFVDESFPYKKAAVNEHVFIARTNEKVFPKYLFYFLFSLEGQEQIKKCITGSAQGGINLSIQDKIFIKFPKSLALQQKIVQAIETQFSRLDEAIENLKSVKKKIKTYRQSVLKKAFEKKEGWEEKGLFSCFKSISPTNKIPKSQYLKKGKLPIIDQGSDLIGGYIEDISKKQIVDLPIIIFGDHTRRFKYIDFDFVAGADGVKILKVNPEIDPKFFYYQSFIFKFPNKGYSRHFQYLKKVNFVFPKSLDEQQKIVQEIESKFSVIDNIEKIVDESLKKAERLRKSILKVAFEGRLVK